jgi:predicted lipid-binding transport protein (Tim44 family)
VAQARRVRRVVRKIDTWTVAKIAAVFHLCMALVSVVAGVILWNAADSAGFVAKLDKSVRSNFQLSSFQIHGGVMFRGAVVGALLLALLFTVLTTVAALLYNLLSDVVGGVQIWVLEEVVTPGEPAAPAAASRAEAAPADERGNGNGHVAIAASAGQRIR